MVEKQLTIAIFEDKTIQLRVSLVNINNSVHIHNCWYSMNSPMIKVRLENGSQIITLLVTKVEINVKIREVIENGRLVMRKSLKLEFVSYTGHN